MSRERLLPDEKTLEKVARYEAHLSRGLYKALHELEALQARRTGGAAPLARLDVDGLTEAKGMAFTRVRGRCILGSSPVQSSRHAGPQRSTGSCKPQSRSVLPPALRVRPLSATCSGRERDRKD
jgi:hypothetical protein